MSDALPVRRLREEMRRAMMEGAVTRLSRIPERVRTVAERAELARAQRWLRRNPARGFRR